MFPEFVVGLPKLLGLDLASMREGTWVEVQYDVLSTLLGQAEPLARPEGDGEVRGRFADFQHEPANITTNGRQEGG